MAEQPACPATPTLTHAGEEGRLAESRAGTHITVCCGVLSAALRPALLHDFMKNVAAFKTAKLLFPLFLFETANLKNCPSHFFYVTTTTKGGLLRCCAREKTANQLQILIPLTIPGIYLGQLLIGPTSGKNRTFM